MAKNSLQGASTHMTIFTNFDDVKAIQTPNFYLVFPIRPSSLPTVVMSLSLCPYVLAYAPFAQRAPPEIVDRPPIQCRQPGECAAHSP